MVGFHLVTKFTAVERVTVETNNMLPVKEFNFRHFGILADLILGICAD